MVTNHHALLLEVQKARAAAREVHGRIARQPKVTNPAGCGLAAALEDASAGVMLRWGLLIDGTCSETPLNSPEFRRDLFEILLTGLHTGEPPAAELLVFCHRALPPDKRDPMDLENLMRAVFAFAEASQPAVQAAVAGSASSASEVEASLATVLHAVDKALQSVWEKNAELRRGDAASVRAFTFEAATELYRTYCLLVQTLDLAKNLLPTVPEFDAQNDVEHYAETLLLTASRLQTSAEKLSLLVDGVPQAEVSPEYLNDVRLGLATVFRTKMSTLMVSWIDKIESSVTGFKVHPVLPELNRKLTLAMIDRLANQSNHTLYKACREVYEARKQSLSLDSMTHALKLFHPAAMQLLSDTTSGAIDPSLVREQLLLMRASDGLVSRMLDAVVLEACKIMGEEYLWLRARYEDPRPPNSLYDGDVLRLLGATIGEKYRIDAYINHGGFSHGFRGTRLADGEEVFIKTFKTAEERPRERDRIAMIVDLENNHRISREPRLICHHNIVNIYEVLRGVSITLPVTGNRFQNFHAVVTEYCDGGELYNYLASDDVQPFSEDEAHYLFKQIVELLKVLHMDDEPYFHGDIKEDNLVLSFPGAVLKLIDYGSLRKVHLMSASDKSTLQHNTADTHGHPFLEGVPLDKRPEAIDVWGGVVCLYRMLTKCNWSLQWEDDLPSTLSKNGAKDVLKAVLRPEGITLSDLLQHPWVKKDCVISPEEMELRLKERYQGIRNQPRGEMWFNLGVAESQKAFAEMIRIISCACDAPPMHRFRCRREGDCMIVSCHHTSTWQPTTSTIEYSDGEVLGEYVSSIEHNHECEVVRAGDPVDRTSLRMKLKWSTGSEWRQFNEFAQRIKDVLCNKIVPVSELYTTTNSPSARRKPSAISTLAN
eukprot:TRINITY_DN3147_c0_g1_i1.p1 TRINITY_DN3147_c0_g1~~TRINITY_DN3147_c0_g1_i1.p1  ORF type:complete len:882 (+),score=126.71 TRINITY_DN3147_c0_g1_i1:53-2698(+)